MDEVVARGALEVKGICIYTVDGHICRANLANVLWRSSIPAAL